MTLDLSGLTLAERILSVRANRRVMAGELVVVEIDGVMVVDSIAPSVIARIENDLGGRVRNPERVSFRARPRCARLERRSRQSAG